MNEINKNISSMDSPLISSHSIYSFPDILDDNPEIIFNQTFSLLQFNYSWIFPLFILSLFGILLTIIILFFFFYFSIRRLNDHLIQTNLFICFSVCFIYIIVIVFLIRPNEFLCGLREFLSQFAYVLLYSGLLCRYIMQWLSTRILSKRTKQLTSLLIYFLLIFIQIPIGILWWYFTIPHFCQYQTQNKYPKLKFHLYKRIIRKQSCSYQCIVDYRFYATYTYIIFELFLCTIIAIYLFFYRYCHRNKIEKLNNNNYHGLIIFFNMFGLILINLTWLCWTFIYYFTHTIFVFPAIIIGMFTIGTISLVFILFPQIFVYSKNHMNDIDIPKTTLFSNKLASTEDIYDQDLLVYKKQNKHQILTNGSELSYELGTSGTFLPITKTPKGPFKVINKEKTRLTEKLDHLIYGEHSNTTLISNNQDKSIKNERKLNTPVTDVTKNQLELPIAPLQRQSTSSSIASDFVNPVLRTEYLQRSKSNIPSSSTSMYYSSNIPPYHDETFIPILCSSQKSQRSTPVQMRILVKSPSSSVPTTRRVYSGNDHRYIQQYPYHHISSTPPPLPATPLYYSSPMQQQRQHVFVDPYRTIPSYSAGNLMQSVLPISRRYPYPYRRFHKDNRSLSQRLWDIDSEDDQDEIEENILNTQGHITPAKERLEDFRSSHIENNDNLLLNIIDDDEENSDNKKLVFV